MRTGEHIRRAEQLTIEAIEANRRRQRPQTRRLMREARGHLADADRQIEARQEAARER